MATFPRVALVGVSALALAGGTALGLTGVTSSSAAPPKEPGTVQVQTVADDNAGTAAPADEAQAAGGEPDAPVLLQADVAAKIPGVTRDQVIARAKTWHPHTSQRIPYSQNRTHGGYRTDCSGYASMALRLPRPGPNTVALATSTYTSPIAMSQLKKADLVIDAIGGSNNRHVVIFERWTSSAHTAYWAFEQRGGYGTDHRILKYGLVRGSQYHAHRPKNIIA